MFLIKRIQIRVGFSQKDQNPFRLLLHCITDSEEVCIFFYFSFVSCVRMLSFRLNSFSPTSPLDDIPYFIVSYAFHTFQIECCFSAHFSEKVYEFPYSLFESARVCSLSDFFFSVVVCFWLITWERVHLNIASCLHQCWSLFVHMI